MVLWRLSAAVGLAAILAGCSGVVDPSNNAVDTFSGTLAVGSVGPIHLFTASKNGEYTVTLTSLVPTTGSLIGIGYGQPIGGVCSLLSAGVAIVGRPALNGGIDKGNYCVQLYDQGTLTQAENYTLTVSHP